MQRPTKADLPQAGVPVVCAIRSGSEPSRSARCIPLVWHTDGAPSGGSYPVPKPRVSMICERYVKDRLPALGVTLSWLSDWDCGVASICRVSQCGRSLLEVLGSARSAVKERVGQFLYGTVTVT